MTPGFTQIDDDAIKRSYEVGPTAFVTYAAIAQHVRTDRTAWPGVERLAEMTGLSGRWTRHAIKTLEAAGWLLVKRSKGKPNTYHLPTIKSKEPQFPTTKVSKELQFPGVRNPSSQGEEPQFLTVRNPSSPEVYQEANHRSKPKKQTKRGTAAAVVIPKELDTEIFTAAWNRWLAYRRERRLTTTSATLEGQITKLARLGPAAAAEEIDNSIINGWQSVCYKPGGNGHARKNGFPVGPGQRHGEAVRPGVF